MVRIFRILYIRIHRSPSRSRRTSSVSRSGKSLSQRTHGDDHFYRPRPRLRPSPILGPRDLGPTSRVYDSNSTDSKMTDVRSSSSMTASRATKHCVESNPKSTEDDMPTGFEILSR